MSPSSGRRPAAAPTLVLDLDGTLVDTAADLVDTLNVILKTEGLAPLGFLQARDLVGHGARAMLESGLAASGAEPSAARIESLFERFIAHYETHIADKSAPFPGALTALDRFSHDGWRLAICTNKLESLARRLLGEIGIAERFAVIAGRDSFGVRKPDHRHLTETIAMVGGDPAAAIMVGDSILDISTARAAGVPVVGVAFGYSPVPIVELQPDCVIAHFDELFEAASGLLRASQGAKPRG